ncbi:MAG: M67 family metallopeptidase, partial [Candidatus Omnitrophica bacterium]|nr:M67 family metallopeptidase [Candidatus Omnitrophota bacterium]
MIHLTKEQYLEIIQHCQNEYPKEACGILCGKIVQSSSSNVKRIVTNIYKMANISDSPETCYFMNPEEQLKVFKEIRKLGIEMLGIY